jgi:hypothetical protein
MTSYKTCLGNSNQKLIQCSSNLLGLVMLDIVARFKNRHDLVVFEGSMPFCVELDITGSDALARIFHDTNLTHHICCVIHSKSDKSATFRDAATGHIAFS